MEKVPFHKKVIHDRLCRTRACDLVANDMFITKKCANFIDIGTATLGSVVKWVVTKNSKLREPFDLLAIPLSENRELRAFDPYRLHGNFKVYKYTPSYKEKINLVIYTA